MGEDTQKTQDFTEAHPGNTSLHGEYTVNGASGLDELYVKDNDRITVEFKADEDYFLKDVIYNGKSMLGNIVLSRYVGRNTVVNVPFLSEVVENPF